MRVSHKHKIILLSNPKTGSTSIRKILNPVSEIKSGITDSSLAHHLKAREAIDYLKSINIDWNKYLSITTIRNPYSRAVSNYFYAKPDRNGLHFYEKGYDKNTAMSIDFNDWIKLKIEKDKYFPGMIPYEDFCCDKFGKCLVDIVIPIERIDKELPKILKKVGIIFNKKIPHTNKTSHKDYKFYFNDESRILIENKYKKDIEIGNYVF